MSVIQAEAKTTSIETEQKHIEATAPLYININNIQTGFDISGTTATLKVNVRSTDSQKVSIKMVLQRKDNDSWTKVKIWTKTGTGRQNLSKSVTVTKGQKYRMKYTVTIGSETVTDKTAAKTA